MKMDSSYAESHFLMGRVFEALKDSHRAKKEYRLAREFDRIHLRACAEMQGYGAPGR